MWIFRSILWIILMLIIIYFAGENTEQEVQIQFWKWQSVPLKLWLVMFISFAIGVFFWMIFSIFKIIQYKNFIRKLKREIKKYEAEVEQLKGSAQLMLPNTNSISGNELQA
ncbi:LapA family protein [candidate division KSB1 bacterium]|nr:LapA family protein [candidate division KSB1 bacterium]